MMPHTPAIVTQKPVPRVTGWWLPAALLAMLLLGAGLYSNTLEVPFYFDDRLTITENPHIRLQDLSWQGLQEAALESRHPRRALAYITLALNYYLGGFDVTGYHLVNIAIHLVNGLLVFWFYRLLLGWPALEYPARKATLLALLAALLWLVHPLHTQSVTYIIQRMNSLATLFYLAAFIAYIRARLATRTPLRWSLFAISLSAGVLAMLTKEMTAVLPLFIFLYEWFFFRDLHARWIKRNSVLLAATLLLSTVVAALYLGIESFGQLSELGFLDYSNRDFTLSQRLLTEPRVVLYYLGQLAWPHPSRLSLLHDFPLSYSLLDPPSTLLAIVAIAGLLIAACWLARKERVIAFLIFWFFGHLVIESSILPLEIFYEHRTYLPSIGFILLVVILVSRLRLSAWMTLPAMCLLAAVWSVWTWERNALWRDPVAFWTDAAGKAPATVRPYNNLGVALKQAGRVDAAYEAYSRAIAVHDEYLRSRRRLSRPIHWSTLDGIQSLAYYNRGNILQDRGELQAAKRDYDQAIRIAPRHSGNAHLNRGMIEQRLGKLQPALDDYSMAITLQADNYLAWSNRGLVNMLLNNDSEALADLDAAIRLNPRYPIAWGHRGNLQRKLGRPMDAVADYRMAITLNPEDPLAYANLGNTLENLGDLDGALEAYSNALILAPLDWPQGPLIRRKLTVLRDSSGTASR